MFDFRYITGPEDSKQQNFSSLCTCLLMRIHPDAKPVEGKGGDEGIDTYVGEFGGHLHAFQHKYFLEGLRVTQKRQILKSLTQALSHHHLASWTLMLPKDLTPGELRWFEGLQANHTNLRMDWWGKTKLLAELTIHRDLAAAFQPANPINMLVVQTGMTLSVLSHAQLEQQLKELGFTSTTHVLAATMAKLTPPVQRPGLRIMVLGPGPSGGDLYVKRLEIRDRLSQLGHTALFAEDLISAERLAAGGLNLSIQEYMQIRTFDYIICLMAGPGAIGEVHDFAKKRQIACKMMVCVDQKHRSGYSAGGVLRIFEGLNGKLDWFRTPEDLSDCHLATRVLRQIENTAEAKTWELCERGE